MEPMTHAEVEAKAKEVFGPNAEVRFSDSQWVVHTQVEEKFNPLAMKDEFPHAFEASEEYEATYGSTLDRWAAKNGMGWSSQAEIFRAYEEMTVREFKSALALVRKMVAEGRPFNWEGGEDYKERMLKTAEGLGW